MRRPSRALFVFVLMLSCAQGAAAQQTRSVLMLHSFDRESTTQSGFAGMTRTELGRRSAAPINFIELSLQSALLREQSRDRLLVEYLRYTLAGQPLDLVLTFGSPAALFAEKYRHELFPSVPVVLAYVDRRSVSPDRLTGNDTAVLTANDPLRVLDNIVGLLPDVRNLYVVIGTSRPERFWREQMALEFQHFKGKLEFVWFDKLSFSEILERCARLPPQSAILFTLFAIDGAGVSHMEDRALAELHAVANAPIFGLHSTQLGNGVVGGPVMPLEDLARNTANVASRILAGESPAAIKTPDQHPNPPQYDWRELQRWNIDERRLPPGSVVRFRQPSLWERYHWAIVAAAILTAGQAVLILGLLVVQIKRRRAEHSLKESEERFRLLSDAAPVMVWTTGTENLGADFNRPWLEFRGRTLEEEKGQGWAEGVHPDDRDRCIETCSRAFDRREPFRMEFRLRRFDGEYRWVLDSGVPRFTRSGRFVGYIGSCVDITEHRQAKAALSHLTRRLLQAHEEERTRIARELHDDLGQRVVGLTLKLHGLAAAQPDDVRTGIRDLSAQFSGLGRDIQAISHRLHSAKLEHLGIGEAASALCQEIAAQRKLRIDFKDGGVPARLPHNVALGIYRVLQEALNNAVKYSRCSRIQVTLGGKGDQIELTIRDDGIGFDLETAMRSEGLGLVTMQERIALINGTFHLDSKYGGGTSIRVFVPWPHVHQVRAREAIPVREQGRA